MDCNMVGTKMETSLNISYMMAIFLHSKHQDLS
jgi:hypothetical protein